MKKRCEVALLEDGWQVSFFPGGGLPPIVKTFDRESQALLAVSEWCGGERARGYDVDLQLPPLQDGRATG